MDSNKKIILIEDDLFLRDLYSRSLLKSGFDLKVAVNGQEALDVVKNNPDAKVIFLDVLLPKVDGMTVLKQIKQDESTKNIPVVMLTNLGDDAIIKEAFQIGAYGYLIKMQLTPREMLEYLEKSFHLSANS